MTGRHRARGPHGWIHWLLLAAALILLVTGVVELGGFAWLVSRF
jgi:hypothetical protein